MFVSVKYLLLLAVAKCFAILLFTATVHGGRNLQIISTVVFDRTRFSYHERSDSEAGTNGTWADD
jgi:hypothetical protein